MHACYDFYLLFPLCTSAKDQGLMEWCEDSKWGEEMREMLQEELIVLDVGAFQAVEDYC